MKKRTLLQECLLSAAAIAVPGLCLASDHKPLQPVNGGSSLKAVPSIVTEPTIRLAQFSPKTGRAPQPAAETPNAVITLVQHGTPAKPRRENKKPGFFKRMFAKRPDSGDTKTATTGIPAGQPGVSIPKPPPIDFTMPGQKPTTSSGVPSKTISFSNSTPPTYQAAHSKDATQRSVPAVQPNTQQTGLPSLRSPVRSTPSRDGFISPFVSETIPHEADTLLDLDSLIQGPQKGTARPQSSTETKQPVAQQLIEKTDDAMEVIAAKKQSAIDAAIPAGPFTGYRLPSDDEVLGLQEPAQKPEPIVETVPETVANLLPEPPAAIVVEEQAETIVQVPLLEEPTMALPHVAAPAAPTVQQTFELPEPHQTFTRPALIDPVDPRQTERFQTAEAKAPKAMAPSFVEQHV